VTIVARAHPFVIGLDTHARNHTLAILVAATGALIGSEQFPTRGAGMDRAATWVARRTGRDLAALCVIERIATYGARLLRVATQAG
jgi:transposase